MSTHKVISPDFKIMTMAESKLIAAMLIDPEAGNLYVATTCYIGGNSEPLVYNAARNLLRKGFIGRTVYSDKPIRGKPNLYHVSEKGKQLAEGLDNDVLRLVLSGELRFIEPIDKCLEEDLG